MVERENGARVERTLTEIRNVTLPNDMKQSRLHQKLRVSQGFSLIELLVVIAIIGVLASLVVGLSGIAGRKSREAKVRAELAQYVTAIERFKDHFGYYPPDNFSTNSTGIKVVDPTINPLFYELTGVFVDNKAEAFQSGQTTISAGMVSAVFRRDGFVNAVDSTQAKSVKSFLPNLKASQVKTVRIGKFNTGPVVQLLVVPVDYPPSYPGPRPNVFPIPAVNPTPINPWRYVSTNPTNNPNSFDLWAEVPLGREIKVIGNWKE